MFATRVGSLIGTPAYMAPEQARGETDKLDARSDLYSTIVLLHELMGLTHYLDGKPTVEAMLASIVGEEVTFFKLLGLKYPHGMPTAELIHVIFKGLSKDPAKRFQSAAELIGLLNGILEGKVAVQCHITFAKRSFRQMGRLVDRAPYIGFATLMGISALVVFALVQLVRMAIA
jgi:serine/threonine-protein kinase